MLSKFEDFKLNFINDNEEIKNMKNNILKDL